MRKLTFSGDRDISFDCTIFGAISSFLLDFTDAVYKIGFSLCEVPSS